MSKAKQAVIDAIQDYVNEEHGDGAIVTDFAVSFAVVSMHAPAQATHYHTLNRGPIHSMLGLSEFQKEHFKMLNREEMMADADADGEDN